MRSNVLITLINELVDRYQLVKVMKWKQFI